MVFTFGMCRDLLSAMWMIVLLAIGGRIISIGIFLPIKGSCLSAQWRVARVSSQYMATSAGMLRSFIVRTMETRTRKILVMEILSPRNVQLVRRSFSAKKMVVERRLSIRHSCRSIRILMVCATLLLSLKLHLCLLALSFLPIFMLWILHLQ